MNLSTLGQMRVKIYQNDLPREFLDIAITKKIIGWDIETSGLDWRTEKIATCQICLPDEIIAIVRVHENIPSVLTSLLANAHIRKVFHHAMFDLRFMSYKWKVAPVNVACTKIVAKLLDPKNKYSHTLQFVLQQYLNVIIDKKESTSNWFAAQLTENQVAYAARDVMYLIPLLEVMETRLQSENRLRFERACFNFIPTKVQLDILGYVDVFNY